MKILHTSDWHLGKKLNNWSRLEEQKEILSEILEVCRKEDPELILLSGDLYDSWNPPHEAIELLYRTLSRMSDGGRRIILALAGNHDAPEHIEAPDALARESGIFFIGYPGSQPADMELESGVKILFPEAGMVLIKGLSSPLRVICTPYASETRMRQYLDIENREEALRNILTERWKSLGEKYFDKKGINLMAAHLFMGNRSELLSEEEPEGEKSILHPGGLEQIFCDALPSDCQYMALGHLHRGFPVSTEPVPAVYSGSPGAYSLSENHKDKSVVLIDLEPGKKARYNFIKLKSPWPLYRETFEDCDEAVSWLSDHPGGYVEITMRTEAYLTGSEKQKILKSHPRILSIIPELLHPEESSLEEQKSFAGKTVQEIFGDYYRHSRQNSDPSDQMLNLLEEIISRGNA
ncbi:MULTISPECIES: exonuclease subunit SbcD [unclassified Oceanispirochaeta]|uniref:metallophosphoesterase family protein n=1 Tax=unclassified Oceanispirochaeta TaxID=2635722 RepID=UPI000E092410|nr:MULTISPECIES: exonuclease subunit SbcD [unclassified Oceanispirochaeta]MBF9015297.1 exonuclease subunit SbcD [Oceanispirochaeta sp. M2]NPD71755.1 exonuclease subunit SbcD [Oceanispirochaeta sp. M1]RDG32947.1 exonuclease subunit SbcD [Oceanispirochaeta sp. M1]